MKKNFIALSVVAVLFMAFPVHAMLGADDPVPGTDILAPFFLVEVSGTETTYIVITETGGVATSLHWTLYDRSSRHIEDRNITLTALDVEPLDVRDMLSWATAADKLQLTYTVGGKDWYAGYIDFDNYGGLAHSDTLIAHAYQLDLDNGKASGVIFPAREWAGGLTGTEEGFNTNAALRTRGGAGIAYEVFSPDAMAYGKDLLSRIQNTLINETNIATEATTFRLLPRFYVRDTDSKNYIIVHKSNHVTAPTGYQMVVTVCNEAEDCTSKNLNLPYELNVIDIADVNPSGVTAGWWDIKWPDGQNAGITDIEDEDLLAYSYQQSTYAAESSSWNVLFAVHREVATN